MSVYTSTANSYQGSLLGDASFHGSYEDASGYDVIRFWVSSPNGAITLRADYADSAAGASVVNEYYSIFAGHASSIHSMKKKRWAKTVLINQESTEVLAIKGTTKFAQRIAHPVLTYSTDDITANVTMVLDDLVTQPNIDHSTHSIKLYGGITTTSVDNDRSILTDNCGRVLTTVSGAIMALKTDGTAVTMVTSDGKLDTRPLSINTDSMTVSGVFVAADGSLNIRALNVATDTVTAAMYIGSNLVTLGQKAKNESLAVTMASDQGALTISGVFVAADGSINIRALNSTTDTVTVVGHPTSLGQKAKSASLAVTMASDQGALTISGVFVATDGSLNIRAFNSATDTVTTVGTGTSISSAYLALTGSAATTNIIDSNTHNITGIHTYNNCAGLVSVELFNNITPFARMALLGNTSDHMSFIYPNSMILKAAAGVGWTVSGSTDNVNEYVCVVANYY